MIYYSQPEARSVKTPPAMNQEEFWVAVQARDARLDGAFVFAVRSTGIYCRPSCPARRPHREQVLFFSAPEAAERAGFRSCRRCKPGRATTSSDPQIEMVSRVCRMIEDNPEAALTLDALAEKLAVSRFRLQRVFKRVTGVTPRRYAEAVRAGQFRAGISRGATVSRAIYEAGYGSSSRLYERASAELGMTPATYRKGGRGMTIRYATVACSLGRLLVGSTERGVCAVSLGDSDTRLENELRKEYPAAEIQRDDHALGLIVKTLLAHLAGDKPHLDLPIDVQATSFQRRVWEELQKIPYGRTRSYGAIASAIGRPSAVRAVARACASNRVALVVPCHRAIREDRSLGGYRWGLDRKEKLIRNEKSG